GGQALQQKQGHAAAALRCTAASSTRNGRMSMRVRRLNRWAASYCAPGSMIIRMIPFDTTAVFIGGHWRAASSRETIPLTNPSDGTLLAQIARGTAADIDAAVAAAHAALAGDWGRLTAAERGRVLLRISAKV